MSMKENPISRNWNLLTFISVAEIFSINNSFPETSLFWEGTAHLSNNTSKLDWGVKKEDRLNQKKR